MQTYSPKQRPVTQLTVERHPATVARGAYLVNNVLACFACHGTRDYQRYAEPVVAIGGGECFAGVPGTVCAPNITPDTGNGIGMWSDDEILRALREGIDRDGKALFPVMPYLDYRRLSDKDAHAVVAFLRTIAKSNQEVRQPDIDFPASFFYKLIPQPIAEPV